MGNESYKQVSQDENISFYCFTERTSKKGRRFNEIIAELKAHKQLWNPLCERVQVACEEYVLDLRYIFSKFDAFLSENCSLTYLPKMDSEIYGYSIEKVSNNLHHLKINQLDVDCLVPLLPKDGYLFVITDFYYRDYYHSLRRSIKITNGVPVSFTKFF